MTLTPAYGRDYKNAKDVKNAWVNGHDFIIADVFSEWSGKPTNIHDEHTGYINIRYNRLRKVVVV